jgi:hypothetical protein
LDPVPDTLLRASVVLTLLGTTDQLLPSQWSTVPASPATQTSFAAAPQTLLRLFVPLVVDIHEVPFQCAINPASPTTQTSDAEKPHTPLRESVGGAGEGDTMHHAAEQEPPSEVVPPSIAPESFAPPLEPELLPELEAPPELEPDPLPELDALLPPELDEPPSPDPLAPELPQPRTAISKRRAQLSLMFSVPSPPSREAHGSAG